MKKYKVARNCHGFKRRYWEAGTIVEFDDDEQPPRHFELIDDSKAKVKDIMAPTPVELSTLSSYHQGPQITTGMAAGLEKAPPPIIGRKRVVKK